MPDKNNRDVLEHVYMCILVIYSILNIGIHHKWRERYIPN
jgi:hypothetical protein